MCIFNVGDSVFGLKIQLGFMTFDNQLIKIF